MLLIHDTFWECVGGVHPMANIQLFLYRISPTVTVVEMLLGHLTTLFLFERGFRRPCSQYFSKLLNALAACTRFKDWNVVECPFHYRAMIPVINWLFVLNFSSFSFRILFLIWVNSLVSARRTWANSTNSVFNSFTNKFHSNNICSMLSSSSVSSPL